MEKEIKELKDEDFDEYGFAKFRVWANFKTGYYVVCFYTRTPKDNLVLQYNKVTPKNFVVFTSPHYTFSCPPDIKNQKQLEQHLEKMDIVETIKFLLKYNKNQSHKILAAMPSSLYENRQVAEEIFLCIPHEKEILKACTKAIRTKLGMMKKYEEIEKQNKKSPAELENKLFAEYYEGLHELNKSKEK